MLETMHVLMIQHVPYTVKPATRQPVRVCISADRMLVRQKYLSRGPPKMAAPLETASTFHGHGGPLAAEPGEGKPQTRLGSCTCVIVY
jgi:hypothetical protein